MIDTETPVPKLGRVTDEDNDVYDRGLPLERVFSFFSDVGDHETAGTHPPIDVNIDSSQLATRDS